MSYLSLSEALSPEDAAVRDAWVADFRATWNERRLEERVAELPSSVALRRALLVAMVGVDLERRRALGRHPLLDSYFDLYPELHDADNARTLSSVAAAPTFGKYRLERVLGKGGMGEVWLATDTTLDRQVALKRPLTADATLIARLRREAKLVAALDGHSGVCRVHEIGDVDGQFFLALSYVEGQTLEARLADPAELPPRRAVEIVRRVAEVLEYAHVRNIVHRDLKPANIMLAADGTPVVMDFGLSARLDGDHSLSRTGQVIGTPAYMPPEQLRGEMRDMDPTWDVYALGVILYEMLARQRPFAAPHVFALMLQVQTQVPPRPSTLRPGIDPELEAICLKAMAKEAKDRYPTMAKLRQALARYLRSAAKRPPPLLRAPFAVEQATAAREAWAAWLRCPAEGAFDLGGGETFDAVLVPPGTFVMGAPADDAEAFDDERPAHEVTLANAFFAGRYPVTVAQFRRFVEDEGYITEPERDGDGGWGFNAERGAWDSRRPQFTWRNVGYEKEETHPVANVTWNDAQAFCAWLAKKLGRAVRLPTEAEWEYACRAGTTTRRYGGDDIESLLRIANVADASKRKSFAALSTLAAESGFVFTAPVGRFAANGFGLFDTLGNVWEWCDDGPRKYKPTPTRDPVGPTKAGAARAFRGGAFDAPLRYCRASYRSSGARTGRSGVLGFRVVVATASGVASAPRVLTDSGR